jgi:hypothetical protein
MGPQGPAGTAGLYWSGWVNGIANLPVIRYGSGFSVARLGLVGSYRITIAGTVSGTQLVTTVSPAVNPSSLSNPPYAPLVARVLRWNRDAFSGNTTIDIEILSTTTGALVDSDFNFIILNRS